MQIPTHTACGILKAMDLGRKIHRLKVLVVVFVCLLQAGVLAVPNGAQAADPVSSVNPTGALNLLTSPLPLDLKTKPGTSISADLRIKNNGAQPERLKVGLLKFGAFGYDGKPSLIDFKPTDEEQKWVNFSQTVFDAEPNVWKTIKMTIAVPKSAAFGYYYAVTFSRASEGNVKGQRRTALHGSTAILVLLEAVVPNARREVAVADFTSVHGIYEFLPAKLEIRMHNSGNIHLAPRGNIFISQGKQQIPGTIEVNRDLGNILPNSNRIFDTEWTEGFPKFVSKVENGKIVLDKRGDPIQHLDWNLTDLNKFRFGRYTANLLMVYQDSKGRDVPAEAQVSFWVIPWRLIAGVAIVLFLVGAGLWAMSGGIRRRLSRKKKRR